MIAFALLVALMIAAYVVAIAVVLHVLALAFAAGGIVVAGVLLGHALVAIRAGGRWCWQKWRRRRQKRRQPRA